MTGKTVEAQARPDPMPQAGQRPGPPFFAILVVAGLIVIGAGLRATSNIIGPVFLVITLVITVAPLRGFLVRRKWPSWLASVGLAARDLRTAGHHLGFGGIRCGAAG